MIDGLRFPDDHALLVETFGPSFRHVHVATTFFCTPRAVHLLRRDTKAIRQGQCSSR